MKHAISAHSNFPRNLWRLYEYHIHYQSERKIELSNDHKPSPPPPPIMLTIAFRMVKKLQTHRSIFFQHVYFIWAFLDPHPNIYPSNIGIRLFQLWFINTKRPTLEKRARAWGWMWLFNRACSTMSRRLTYMYLFNLHQPLFKVRWSPFTCLSQQGVVEGNLNRKEK